MELKDLYRDVILDHNKRPRNFGQIEHPDAPGGLASVDGRFRWVFMSPGPATDRDWPGLLRTALGLARTFAVLAAPIIPTSAQRVLDAFPDSPAPTLADVIADPLSPLPAGQAFAPLVEVRATM